MNVLFKTVHGSRLYGLSNADSDWDYYTVVDKVKNARATYAKQTIHDGVDSMVVDFGTWIDMCVKGVPQAIEAMFSQRPVVDELGAFRAGYHVSTGVYARYLRTITNFVHAQEYKRKRHGLRLALNMNELSRAGRFNPTLTPNQVDFISDVAHKDTDVVYAYCMNIALDRLPPHVVL